MTADEHSSIAQTWQDALDPQLLRRLWQRALHPGLTRTQLAAAILARLQRLAHPLPLLADVIQRHGVELCEVVQVPIVYVQPWQGDGAHAAEGRTPVHAPLQQRLSVQTQPVKLHNAPAPAPQAPIVQTQLVQVIAPLAEPPGRETEHTTSPSAGAHPAIAQPPLVEPQRPPDAGNAAAGSPLPLAGLHQPPEVPRAAVVGSHGPAQEAASAPALRPVVQPQSRHAEALGDTQRTLHRPVVTETRPATPASAPVSIILAAPGWPAHDSPPLRASRWGEDGRSVDGPPGVRRSDRANGTTVEQSQTSPSLLSVPTANTPPMSSAVAQPHTERELNLHVLAEKVQNALDMDKLVEQVQRQLRRRLAVENERRGRARWT